MEKRIIALCLSFLFIGIVAGSMAVKFIDKPKVDDCNDALAVWATEASNCSTNLYRLNQITQDRIRGLLEREQILLEETAQNCGVYVGNNSEYSRCIVREENRECVDSNGYLYDCRCYRGYEQVYCDEELSHWQCRVIYDG